MKNSLLKNGLVLAALVGAFSVAPASKAEAAFAAYVCNDAACAGGDDVAVSDNGLLGSLNGGVDTVNVLGFIQMTVLNFNGFQVTVNQSQSQPLLANGMDLSYTVTTGDSAGGSIWLWAVTTDYNYAGLTGVLGGTSDNGSVTAAICTLPTNTIVPPLSLAGNCSTGSDNTPPDIAINVARAGLGSPYALAIGVQVNLTGAGTTATGDFRVVPEPALMSLFGLGLAGLAVSRRRRNAS